MRIKLYFLIFGAVLSVSTIAALRMLSPASWDEWKPATCMPARCFCEAVSPAGPILQPVNTWSSLAFVISGSMILGLAEVGRRKKGSEQFSWAYGYLLGVSAIVIGAGSAVFHASLTLVGQFFDVFGMYLLTSFMLAYALRRLLGLSQTVTLGVFTLLVAVLSLLLYRVPETRRYAFAIVLVVAIISEMILRRLRRPSVRVAWWNAGLLLFAAGYVIWILDNFKIVCAPQSLLQGHAVWHILGAVSVVLLYRYYASEGAGVA
jgi:hypothetical protein